VVPAEASGLVPPLPLPPLPLPPLPGPPSVCAPPLPPPAPVETPLSTPAPASVAPASSGTVFRLQAVRVNAAVVSKITNALLIWVILGVN